MPNSSSAKREQGMSARAPVRKQDVRLIARKDPSPSWLFASPRSLNWHRTRPGKLRKAFGTTLNRDDANAERNVLLGGRLGEEKDRWRHRDENRKPSSAHTLCC